MTADDPTPVAEATSLFKNSAFLALGKVSVLLTFLLFVYAARRLGDASFGEFTLSLTIASVLFTLPNWGTNRYSAIIAARRPGETTKIVAENLGLTSLLGLLYLPLILAAAQLLSGKPVVVLSTFLLGLSLLLANVAQLLRLMFRVHDIFLLDTLTSSGERLALAAVAATAIFLFPTPAALAAGFVVGHACGVIAAGIAFVRRLSPIRVRYKLPALRKLFSGGTPIALRNILSWANLRVDMLVLGGLAPSAQLGWYGAVYKLIDGTNMLPSIMMGSLGPTLSASFGAGREEVVVRLYRRGFKYLFITSLFIALVFVLFAEFLITLVFGEQYAPGAVSLQILGGALLFIFLRRLAIDVMDYVDLRVATVRIFFLVLIVNTGLNLLLVPRFGHVGAAGSTLLAEALLAGGVVWTLRRSGYSADILRQASLPLLAALPTAATMVALSTEPILAVALGASVYLVALTLLGTWDQKDRLILRYVLRETRRRLGYGGTG